MALDCKLLYVTASSESEARRIAHELVAMRLAACANILPGMQSVYRWKGQVEEAEECVLILKTCTKHEQACIDAVVGMHSYDTPCVLSLDIRGGNPAFLEWIEQET